MAIRHLSPALVSALSILPDPRKEKNKRHLLIDIVVITLCTCLAGGEGWTDCEDFARTHERWFRRFLALPHGIPSHDVFREVFMRFDPEMLSQALTNWLQELHAQKAQSSGEITEPRKIAVDGKTLRRSADHANEGTPFHLVSAWVSDLGISMGQIAVGDKSNEIVAIPRLLRTMHLKGAIVSIDAMGCQKRIAAQIRRQGGDYVLAVKKNHPGLYSQIEDFFSTAEKLDYENVEYERYETLEKDHGRIEKRVYILVTDVGWLEKKGWIGLKSVGMVIRDRKEKGKATRDVGYHITSLAGKAKTYANAVRNHWSVENQLHWRLDVLFKEDQARMRAEFSAQNFGVFRRVGIGLLSRDTTKGLSMRRKRLRAAWSTEFIESLIFG